VKFTSALLCLLMGILSQPVLAVSMQNEIDHLLVFVKSTDCQYERNGDMHSGADAAEHIQEKYDYFKDDIDSTEQFIELSASKSSMSGNYYRIHCSNKVTIRSQDWLLQELQRYRSEWAH